MGFDYIFQGVANKRFDSGKGRKCQRRQFTQSLQQTPSEIYIHILIEQQQNDAKWMRENVDDGKKETKEKPNANDED